MSTTPAPTSSTTTPLEPLLADLERLVTVESPSAEPAALRRSGDAVAELLSRHLPGEPEIGEDARVRWATPGAGAPDPILVLGHHDTVWPLGSLQRHPFAVHDDGRVTGPGVYDMKAGVVVVTHALAALAATGELPPVELLVTSDEEIGSKRSREEIEERARRARAVLVLEPSGPGGAIKTGRKGVALGRITVRGRAAHSGLDPEKGVNAGVALGPLLPLAVALGDPDTGTTVTPTVIRAGSAMNTVPALAEASLDIRFLEDHEVDRVRAALQALEVPEPARLEIEVTVNRPALTSAATEPLLGVVEAALADVGRSLDRVTVGGASDGNLAAGVGARVLDGLGPQGDGAHADHEHVLVEDLPWRVGFLTALLRQLG